MKSYIWTIVLFFIMGVSAIYSYMPLSLEAKIIKYATNNPEKAPNYFLEQIEAGATIEEQALYLYGIGIAYEKQGNIEEAVNDYLTAKALGNKRADEAMLRLYGWRISNGYI